MSSETDNELTLLGRSESALPLSPDEAKLETFENRNAQRDYWISLDCPDFSSLCPVTGQPDAAKISICYVPDLLCVETKSLKFYLASFRNHSGFNEDIANRIADDLIKACQPRELVVEAQFAPRGGISLRVEITHPQMSN